MNKTCSRRSTLYHAFVDETTQVLCTHCMVDRRLLSCCLYWRDHIFLLTISLMCSDEQSHRMMHLLVRHQQDVSSCSAITIVIRRSRRWRLQSTIAIQIVTQHAVAEELLISGHQVQPTTRSRRYRCGPLSKEAKFINACTRRKTYNRHINALPYHDALSLSSIVAFDLKTDNVLKCFV